LYVIDFIMTEVQFKKKRSHAPNFTRDEEQLLLKLGNQHKILENKTTDGNMNELKNEAWMEIAKKFNANNMKVRWRNISNQGRSS